jgi:hypothetical protein
MPGERPLGLLQFHDERRRRRAELVKHLRVVDDRVLLHARRLLGFLHVASANRGVCKSVVLVLDKVGLRATRLRTDGDALEGEPANSQQAKRVPIVSRSDVPHRTQ